MKKLLVSVWTIVAIASFGGTILPVHAATLTPAEQATLQQSLDSMKAKLLQLETQANAQQAAAGTQQTQQFKPATGLSPADLAAVNSALTALASALTNLQATITNKPDVATANAAGIGLALQGIGHTLSMIVTTVAGGNAGNGNIASAVPSKPSAPGASAPAATAPSTAAPSPSAAVVTPPTQNTAPGPVATAPEAATAQTAQVASFWSFQNLQWPYIVVGILVILAVALWLFWPGEDEETAKRNKKGNGNAPVAQIKPIVTVSNTQTPPMTVLASSGKPVATSPQTPLSTAVSAPNQQQQQRKPA